MNTLNKTLLTGVIVSSLLGAPNAFANADDLYVKAQHFYQNKEIKAATIELKNALKEAPNHVKSRLLLADIYVQQLQGAAAEDELRKAIKAGANRTDYLHNFAKALHIQHKSDELLQELQIQGSDSANIQAFIHAMHGEAYFFKQEFDNAKKFYLKATALFPEHPMGNTGLAKLDFLAGRIDQAETIINEVLTNHADYFDALLIKGDIDSRKGRYKQAVDAYSQALKQHPNHLLARLGRADNQIQLQNYEDADKDLDLLLKIDNPQLKALSTYLKAKILHINHKVDEALALLKTLDKLPIQSPQHHMLKGQIYFEKGQDGLAEDELKRFVHAQPEHLIAHKLLANIQLKLHKPDKVVIALSKFEANNGDDAGLLTLLGEAYLQQNQLDQAKAYFERALALTPEQDPIRTKLAITLLKMGKVNSAIAELEKTRETAQQYPEAEVFLISTLIEKNMFEHALKNSDDFIKNNPDSPIGYNLKGMVLLEQNKFAAADQLFDQALQKNANFYNAYLNKSRIAIKQQQDAKAEQLLKKVLKMQPGEVKATIGIASIYERQDTKKAQQWLEQAWKQNKENKEIGIALLQLYLKDENKLLSLNHASDLNVRFPDDRNVQLGLVKAHVQNGNIESAYGILNQLISKHTDDLSYVLILANIKQQQGEGKEALAIYDKVIAKKPSLIDAWLGKIQFQLQQKDVDGAIATTQALKKAYPNEPTGYELEGNIYSSQQQWQKALPAYLKAFEITKNALNADKLHEIYLKLGQPEQAISLLQDWLKENPNNAALGFKLATALLNSGKLEASYDMHKQLLQQLQGNQILLNNLAWLSHALKKDDTQRYIEQILAQNPDTPTILDTVGWIMVDQKNAKGLELLRKAHNSAQDDAEILYHTAIAEQTFGSATTAKTLLQQLIKQHPNFSDIGDAKKRLQQIP